MEGVTPKQRSTLAKKFKEFRLQGLKAYGNYVEHELETVPDTKLKKYYRAYLKKELSDNKARIAKLKTEK